MIYISKVPPSVYPYDRSNNNLHQIYIEFQTPLIYVVLEYNYDLG